MDGMNKQKDKVQITPIKKKKETDYLGAFIGQCIENISDMNEHIPAHLEQQFNELYENIKSVYFAHKLNQQQESKKSRI